VQSLIAAFSSRAFFRHGRWPLTSITKKSRGKKQDGADECDQGVKYQTNDPEGNRKQPDNRPKQQGQECERPADDQQESE
jgi:hypothetical protein